MLADKRYERIVEITDAQGFVKTRELADLLGVSETTIRRDVEELDTRRRLIRVHGGAKSLEKGNLTTSQDEKLMRERVTVHAREKEAIARRAVEMVRDGDCVFLDGGTTILPMLDILKDRKITIVTHSALIVEAFREGTARLFVLPGDFDTYYSMFTGPVTGQILSRFHFDFCFISCLGINPREGAVLASETLIPAVKRGAMERATRRILMADSSKMNVRAFYTMADLSEFDLVITDPGLHQFLKDDEIPENFVFSQDDADGNE
ncbi:DeoR/GlpR family DNA-binding transcription regulator [uncultured Faecalibaculum sp.]|uniref:DeoR/GlpR family DNA-binding transcription regulator n=1 Tax=uncultured Faecalibaculum sp. TaxID=1729681 RepID=UPI00261D5AC6|nr:DeoR/GlpR family DNA-binding transcription regulator [uncultured Faecalibaculum sp.]